MNYIEKLTQICKIWGFLKYYHPNIKQDWDIKLFNLLTEIKTVTNKNEFSFVIIKLIEFLGEIQPNKLKENKPNSEYLNKNFDLHWTQNKNFYSNKLIELLNYIKENRIQENHFFIKYKNYDTDFCNEGFEIALKNEVEHKNLDWKSEQFRLLNLFRYWNIIEYFFPAKYQTDQKWDDVLFEMIPKFINVKSELDFHLVFKELSVKIDDSHSYFISELSQNYLGNFSLPVKINFIENKLVIIDIINETLANNDDLQIGDIFTKINGKDISFFINKLFKLTNGSNDGSKYRHLANYIGRSDSNLRTIEFLRKNSKISKEVSHFKRSEIKDDTKKMKWKLFENNIGYVNLGLINIEEVNQIMESLLNTKAIIFDIRNYPKGIIFNIMNYLSKTKKEFVKFTKPDLKYIGKHVFFESQKIGGEGNKHFKGKVIALIDEKTQSHAEYSAMALKTLKNSILIGSKTSGADGNVSRMQFNGFEFMYTGLGCFYPDKTETQRIGIIPNIEIKPKIEDLINGIDTVLEKAIEVANS